MNIFGRSSNLQNKFNHKYKVVGIFWIFLLLTSPEAFAHVKWFVTNEGAYANTHFYPDGIAISLVLGFMLFIVCSYFLNLNAATNKTLCSFLYARSSNTQIVWTALKFSVAVLFTANIIQNNFVAPNFVAHPSQFQIGIQGLLIIALILHADLFALLLLIFSVSSLFFYPVDAAIDYSFELIALSLAIYFSHPLRINRIFKIQIGRLFVFDRSINIGLTALRVGLGLQLIILSLHDKFFHPGLALKFLQMHPEFNFVRIFGFSNFSDLHFVLGAGLAELAFGVLLVTNIASRVGLMLILFFFITTGIMLGVEELVGHVPIVMAALVLLFFPCQKSFYIGERVVGWEESGQQEIDGSQKI